MSLCIWIWHVDTATGCGSCASPLIMLRIVHDRYPLGNRVSSARYGLWSSRARDIECIWPISAILVCDKILTPQQVTNHQVDYFLVTIYTAPKERKKKIPKITPN